MDANKADEFIKAVEPTTQKVRDTALVEGSKAICGVILQKAEDAKMTYKERIQDIISFCKTSLGISKKYKERAKANDTNRESLYRLP